MWRSSYGVIAGWIWNRSQSRRKDRMKLFRLIAVPLDVVTINPVSIHA